MHYNGNIGVIYDTIYYGIIFFNEDIAIEKLQKDFPNADIKESLKYYYEVRKTCGELPKCLYPFFYHNEPSLLTFLLNTKVNYHEGNVDNYIDLLADKDLLKRSIFQVLFKNATEDEKNKMFNDDAPILMDCLNKQCLPSDLKISILEAIHYLDYVQQVLIDTFKRISVHIIDLHNKHKNITNKYIIKLSHKKHLKLFCDVLKMPMEKINSSIFTLSFLNQFIMSWRFNARPEIVLLIGLKYEVGLEPQLFSDYDSIYNTLLLLLNKTNLNIIKVLNKYDKLTAKDISEIMKISLSTANRITKELSEAEIIQTVERNKNLKYFSVNKEYIKMFYIELNKHISNMFNEIIK